MKLKKEEIDQLKKKHGELWEIVVDDTYHIYIRKPRRSELRAIFSLATTDIFSSNLSMLKTCCVGGDKEKVLADDELLMATFPYLQELIEVKDAEIKKL